MNNDFDILVASGDSHTAGAEIEFAYQNHCYEKAWPKHLANIANVPEWCNLATSGASNTTIYRTVQTWVVENILRKKLYSPNKVVITVMWSGFNRYEILIKERNELINLNPNLALDETYTRDIIDRLGMRLRFEVLNHDNLFDCYTNLFYVVNLERWLTSLGIANFHSNGIHRFEGVADTRVSPRKGIYQDSMGFKADRYGHEHHILEADYNSLLTLYTRKKYHHSFRDWTTAFWAYYDEHKVFKESKFAKTGHFGEDVQKDYAERMYKFWLTDEMDEEKEAQFNSNLS